MNIRTFKEVVIVNKNECSGYGAACLKNPMAAVMTDLFVEIFNTLFKKRSCKRKLL